MKSNPFRSLPAVHDILAHPGSQVLKASHAHEAVVAAIRCELDEARRLLSAGGGLPWADVAEIVPRIAERLGREYAAKLRPVINATGIVLHTNLGRAPLADEAARAALDAARGYLNLEMDLETGKRSSRQAAVRAWLCNLTGAESATAVNNNAAATVIALRALCRGKEVIISRGQLIEIGGSFRIPEIMEVSGARLREVGTTNITRLSDFDNAIGPETAALMQVHTSNYRIAGFTEAVPLGDLVALGKKRGLVVIDDVGSGAMLDFARFGFTEEPVVGASIAAGADLVLFSGDKLLGGPQAGIIVGKSACIAKIEKDPLMRAFRLDKMTLAALEATLRLYLHGEKVLETVPILRMLGTPLQDLKVRADNLAAKLGQGSGVTALVLEDHAFVGGGSLPDQKMPTWVVALQPTQTSDTDLAQRLRTGTPAVLARVQSGKVLLDVRTIFPWQEEDLVQAVAASSSPVQKLV